MYGKAPEALRHSPDRRVVRTKTALHHALRSLILRRSYEAITIKEICAAADVARSTFYAHYTGKDDLKRDGLERLRTRLLDEVGRQGALRFAFSLPMFEHARDHLDMYRALAGSTGRAIALGGIRQILCELVRKEVKREGKKISDARRELIVQYYVGAYMSVLTSWLDGGANLPVDQVDVLFRGLALEGITA
jgi:AcrR family transcriptional regulator